MSMSLVSSMVPDDVVDAVRRICNSFSSKLPFCIHQFEMNQTDVWQYVSQLVGCYTKNNNNDRDFDAFTVYCHSQRMMNERIDKNVNQTELSHTQTQISPTAQHSHHRYSRMDVEQTSQFLCSCCCCGCRWIAIEPLSLFTDGPSICWWIFVLKIIPKRFMCVLSYSMR